MDIVDIIDYIFSNPWTVAIVGGLASTVLGGLALAALRYRERSAYGAHAPLLGIGTVIAIARLALFGALSVAFIGVVLSSGPLTPESLREWDHIIRLLLIIFAELGLYILFVIGITLESE
jgi:hypothetical protein